MKRARFTESQIVAILKEADVGISVGDVICKHGISLISVQKVRICKVSSHPGGQRKTTRRKALRSKNPAPSAPPKDFFDLLARLRLESATTQKAARESGTVQRDPQGLMTAMQTVDR